jgi:predicted metal-dependent peptidase
VTKDVLINIKKARLSLLFHNPFFGTLAMNLPLVEENTWCTTAAVDGRHIYWNRKFFESLSVDEIVFVLCHELLHVVYDHFGRRSHRDPGYWNMAGDYVINAMLINEKIGSMPTISVPDKDSEGNTSQRVGLYDKRYEGWTSEAVYDDLQKRKVKKQLSLDVHIEMGKDGQTSNGKNQNSQQGQGIPIHISEEELKKIREELKTKVLQAAQASQGKMPKGVARLVDGLIEPKIDWRDLIRETVNSQITADYAWHRPNRRHNSGDVIFPSIVKEETVDIEISIDQSGSINEEMAREVLSEVMGITEQYANWTVAVSCFDTKVYNRKVFSADGNPDLISYKPEGGGGTAIGEVWRYLKRENIQPKLLIVFTDLECDDHGDPNYCNTLFLINNPWNKNIKPKWGPWARYESEKGVTEMGAE